MADPRTQDLQKQYDLIHDTIARKLEQQFDSLSSFDTKASILLTTIGVIFAGYAQLLASDVMFNNAKFRDLKYLVIAEFILFIIAGFFVFKAFVLKPEERWFNDPSPKKLLNLFSQNSAKGLYWLKDEITKNMRIAYDKNDILVRKKYDYILWGRKFLFAGIVILFFHIISLLFGVSKFIIPFK